MTSPLDATLKFVVSRVQGSFEKKNCSATLGRICLINETTTVIAPQRLSHVSTLHAFLCSITGILKA